ncbi:MAG: aspartate/glutamate racemase family protein [Cyanobacteria bacterium QS_3_48_167]|nr:MAG: aspartate/glutamate racemase family protein [Cyanobacteria bacterium QS_3_48_167]
MNQSLGILGGLGPLASAEFLKTIYEYNVAESEQESPICILYSDPTFPERVDAITRGENELLTNILEKSLEKLCQMGVSKIAIACFTMHYFLPQIREPLREKVISLIDVVIQKVSNTEKTHLLLCANGAQSTSVFEQLLKLVKPNILLLDDADQTQLNDYIFKIKKNDSKESLIKYLDTLSRKYKVESMIAGCTELHIINKYLINFQHQERCFHFIDPLLIIAQKVKKFLDA